MRHELPPRLFQAFILTIALTLAGCTPPQRDIPTAVIYDQSQDSFTVEVEPIAQDATPVYRDTLDLFTIIDGQKHPGIIPPAAYRMPEDPGVARFWNGLGSVHYKNSKWKIGRWTYFVPRVKNAVTPLKIQVIRRDEYSPPIYSFLIDGAQHRVD